MFVKKIARGKRGFSVLAMVASLTLYSYYVGTKIYKNLVPH